MLEVLRLYVETGQVPSSPLIFLFNGGEEVFMKVRISHSLLPKVQRDGHTSGNSPLAEE